MLLEVGADHFADAASGAQRHICKNDRSRQSNFPSIGKRKDFGQVPKGDDTAEAQGTDREAFEQSSAVDLLTHLTACLHEGQKQTLPPR